MCGIAGLYNYNKNNPILEDQISKMCDVIAHRGPDGKGSYIDKEQRIGLGNRRLSIIDLQTGDQPMTNERNEIWITFNGEIYNYLELRSHLREKGYRFITKSDTEVIINLYEEYGEESFAKLNGMFAIAIWDSRKKKLILVRDHFGVKPLYYTLNNGQLIFGSEIKSILTNGAIRREIDKDALQNLLTFRYNPSPQTLFKGIHKLSPGHYFSIDYKGKEKLQPFWNDAPETTHSMTEDDAVEEYAELLKKAVEYQMISDVPVGLLLSGGIDSATLAVLMRSSSKEQIKSFSLGFEGTGDYNELLDAKNTANEFGLDHHEISMTKNQYLDFLLDSFLYTEEPVSEPTIPALYYVTKLASEHVKVVLAGQGADEPLAGYHRYLGELHLSKYIKLLSRLPLTKIAALFPRNERLKRAAHSGQFKIEHERFLNIHSIFTENDRKKLMKKEFQGDGSEYLHTNFLTLYNNSLNLEDSVSRLQFIDTRMNLSDDLLLFGDKMSMANSLEMRVPYLDVNLVNFLETLPSSFKLRGTKGKIIHKRAISRWLPDSIISRKKRGFATPIDKWLQSGLGNNAKLIFNEKDSAAQIYFDLNYVNSIIDAHQSGREDHKRKIFILLSFEIWYKTFFQQKSIDKELFLYSN